MAQGRLGARPGSTSRVLLACSLATLLTAGCGTRVLSEDRAAPFSPEAVGPTGDIPPSPIADAESGAGVQSQTLPKDGVTSTPAVGSGSTPTTAHSGPANPQTPLPRTQDGTSSSGSPPAGQRSIPSGPSATPEVGPRSPVRMASVGTYSGPVGTILEPLLKGAQLWIKAVNAKGGVSGHEIQLLVYDDGGDPARHRAQVQEAVEHQGVIGFFANAEAVTGAATVEYLESKRVPVVGMDLGEIWAHSSPMYFPQASAGDELIRTVPLSIAQQVLARGKKRFGTLICVEAEACSRGDRIIAETAKQAGLDHVYRGQASLAQPDFTAECLSASQKNVEVFAIFLDANSVARVTAACSRQGYHPTYATNLIVEQQKENPEFAGAVGGTVVFPWFQSGTPATDEFRAAVRDYGGGIVLGVGSAMGWAAGKLLERAAARIPEPPTTESLLAGLWNIKADTLGGLTPPLTFVKDQPPARVTCWFNLTVAQRAWVSPDGFRLNCR